MKTCVERIVSTRQDVEGGGAVPMTVFGRVNSGVFEEIPPPGLTGFRYLPLSVENRCVILLLSI